MNFEDIVYNLQQALQMYPDNMNALTSIPEMLLEINEISPDTFNEKIFISISTELIKCPSNLLAKNLNEQFQTATAFCLHVALIFGDITDIR